MSEQERLIDEIAERVWRRLYPHAEKPAEEALPHAQAQLSLREQVEELLEFSHDRQCVVEPGKPCIHSGRCRELGP